MADLFETVEQRALRLWREREMEFPPFVRRMTPDAIDYASGAWAMMLAEAQKTAQGRDFL